MNGIAITQSLSFSKSISGRLGKKNLNLKKKFNFGNYDIINVKGVVTCLPSVNNVVTGVYRQFTSVE